MAESATVRSDRPAFIAGPAFGLGGSLPWQNRSQRKINVVGKLECSLDWREHFMNIDCQKAALAPA